MSFDWNHYLYLAQEVMGQTPAQPANDESYQRCAISRAYYAVFVRARNYLRDVERDPNIPNEGSAHVYVREAFISAPDRRKQQVGILLKNLKFLRGKADYADQFRRLPQNTTTALTEARSALRILDAL